MLKPLLAALLVTGVLSPLPALAQEASPRPGCGAPATFSVVAEPATVDPGATATVTVTVRDEPCYPDERATHAVDLFVQREGSRDPAPLTSGTTDRSGRFSYAEQVHRTSTYYAGTRDGVRRGGNSQATVSVRCPVLSLEATGGTVAGTGQPLDVQARSSDPSSTYRLEVLSPYVGPVRSGSGAVTPFTLRPVANTVVRLRSTVSGQDSCVSAPLRLLVRPALTIAAERVGPRAYVFTGRVLPGRRQLVTLYRLDGARRVIAAQGHVRPDGTYALRRGFSGSGRSAFQVGVSSSRTNLAGSSRVRPTLLH